MSRSLKCRFPAALAAGFVSACASVSPPASTPSPVPVAAHGVERFFPLKDATVFAYDTASEPGGQRGMLVLEVRRSRAGLVELSVAGRVQRVEVDPSGIRHVTGGWLLKEPVSLGARFRGDFGEVEVTALDRKVAVPAGNFESCLETVESLVGADFNKRTTTVYCEGVGITTRRSEVESSEGNGTESLILRSFGPKFDFR